MDQTILVLVKEVAELEDDFEVAGDHIDEKYFEYDLNNLDEFAVEEAVQMKEESDDDIEVVTATIGPERSEETIRMALAKGADRAVRVWDDSLDGTDFLSTQAKTSMLKGIVDQVDPDLIMSGAQADDDLQGAAGVHLASEIGWQWAAVVIAIEEYTPGDDSMTLRRELEGGVEERTTIDTPAVLSIQSGINQPRYASLRGIRQAQSKDLDVYSFDDLGIDDSVLETPIELSDMHVPETETDTSYIEGSPEDIADRIFEIAQDKGVVFST
ncbi:MAG: electron transfer flavoprotein subunit beta/FixA family protein [bacterium]